MTSSSFCLVLGQTDAKNSNSQTTPKNQTVLCRLLTKTGVYASHVTWRILWCDRHQGRCILWYVVADLSKPSESNYEQFAISCSFNKSARKYSNSSSNPLQFEFKSTPIRRHVIVQLLRLEDCLARTWLCLLFCSGRTTTVDRVRCAEVNTTTTPSRQLHHETRRPWRHHCFRLHVRDVTFVKE